MDESVSLPPVGACDAADKPRFSRLEHFSAWLFVVVGYCFCCAFPMSKQPPAAALFLTALYAVTFCFVLRGRVRFGLLQKLVLLSAALAVLAGLLWDNGGDAFLCFIYALTAYAYLVYAATGNCLEEGWSELVDLDLLRALIVFPFSSFGSLFPALASNRDKGLGKSLLKVLLGLLLAVLPTAAALSLLSYDRGFQAILERLFFMQKEDLLIYICRFVFTVPVAMYFFGLFLSSSSRKREEDAERCRARAERRRFVPFLTAAAAVIPLLLVYIIFFVSQWEYYTSAFTGLLPAGRSYAAYAREGFFELCAVAFINFLALICLHRYVKDEHERLLRALRLILALITLVLIGTAMSKLWLYVNRYGLTPDRVYAGWFMVLLTVLFLIVSAAQFFPKVKTLPLCMAVTVALYLLLALSGPNARIARTNVDRFLSDQTQEIDIELLSSLGDDAISEMLRLEREWDRSDKPQDSFLRQELHEALERRACWETDFWAQTLSSRRADRLLRDAGY